jgi:membrane-associated phospholipid phosphatase
LRYLSLCAALCFFAITHSAYAEQPAYPKLLTDDIEYVISAPARWEASEWHNAGWLSLGILTTAALVDRPLQDEMRRHTPNNNSAVLQVERLGAQYSVVVLGGFYLAGTVGNETASEVAQDGLAASLIASGLIAPTIKLVVGRSRPRNNSGTIHFKPFSDLNASFPSGHTTEAFALASVISEHYEQPWVSYSAYGLASMVGLARSYHSAHFASDIVAGAALGTWVGHSVVEHNQTYRTGKLALLPDLGEGRLGMRLAGRF